jgi:ABC-2 type transport system permease protein
MTTAALPARDRSRPLPFLPAARAVFRLSLEGMVWSRRSLLMAILLGLPVVFALLYRVLLVARLPAHISGLDLYALVIARYYVANLLPLAALFYASALVADEVEGKTLTYLLTRPLRRNAILAGKFAAYLATTLSLTLPAVVVTFFLLATSRGFAGLGAAVPELFRDMGVVVLALVSYGALFTLAGVLLKHPVLPGLSFLFVWELLAHAPGYVPRVTLTAWLRSLVHHQPVEDGLATLFPPQMLPAATSVTVLVAASAAFLAASLLVFGEREYVLDQ